MASRRGKQNLTPEQERKFLRLVSEGMNLSAAAKKIGVGKAAISMRRERNKAFAARLEEAEDELESTLSGKVIKAGRSDWRASAWYLERRWPQRWARPEIRNEVTNVNLAASDIAAAIHDHDGST
jgi:monomeric isocitrate dehydrogenase